MVLIKYIIVLYLTQDCYHSLSVREDVDSAKKYLQYHGIPDQDLCTENYKNKVCTDGKNEVCTARLVQKKIEFKQFYNPCHMDLNNLCESQDNIWAIKNFGPCVMDADLRRYAKVMEEKAQLNTTDSFDDLQDGDDTETTTDGTDGDTKTTTDGTGGTETTTDGTDADTETTTDGFVGTETTTDGTDDNAETTTDGTDDDTETATDETDGNTETDTSDEDGTETTTDETATDYGDGLRMGEEIGKIVYDDGSEKQVLRERRPNLIPGLAPNMRSNTTYNRIPCTQRVKPCPVMYYPVCAYWKKETPVNVTYYYFINSCEAQQWSCYHPEKAINGVTSLRTAFCAHIQYINYASIGHTISAWGHYGWLRGPWPFNRILKPHQRP